MTINCNFMLQGINKMNTIQLTISTEHTILPQGSIVKHTYDTPNKSGLIEYLYVRRVDVELKSDLKSNPTDKDICYSFSNCLRLNTSAGYCLLCNGNELNKHEFNVIRYGETKWVGDNNPNSFRQILSNLLDELEQKEIHTELKSCIIKSLDGRTMRDSHEKCI